MNREEAKQQLLRRTQESIKNKERGKFGSIFIKEVQQWKCETGGHKLDIIPWTAGKNISMFMRNVKPGEKCYVLIIYMHFGIGVDDESVLCLSKTFGKPCPICEQKKRLQDADADQADVDALKWKERTLYNVLVHDTKEDLKKGVQVLDIAHFFLEYHLTQLAEADPVTGETIAFADQYDGKQIYFKRMGSGMGSKVGGHQFIERTYEIPDKIMDQAYVLDELLYIPTYDEVYQKLHQGSLPVDSRSAGREDVPDRLGDKPEDDDIILPSKKSAAPRQEEPVRRRNQILEDAAAKKEVCPVGGQYGIDFSELEACDQCAQYDACGDECERLKAPAPAPTGPARKKKKEEPAEDEVLLPPKSKLKGRN